jgi:hypothetical protein
VGRYIKVKSTGKRCGGINKVGYLRKPLYRGVAKTSLTVLLCEIAHTFTSLSKYIYISTGSSGYVEKFVDGKAIRKYHVTRYQNGNHTIVADITGHTNYKEVAAISWTGGSRPTDIPECGFTGDNCTNNGTRFFLC